MDPFGWKGTYADPNKVPDHYLWIPGANNTPEPLLGGRSKQLVPGAILVDDSSSGWSHSGQWQKAKTSSDINGSLHWTSTTSGAATATATWQARVPADGYYEVGAFVDDNHASSGWASYTISSADPARAGVTLKHVAEVDQEHIGNFQNSFGGVTTGAQWVGLGTYYFRTTQPGRVTLSNATGENGQQLAADGVEFAPLAPTTYGFTLTSDSTPTQMLAGSSAKVDLTLKNASTFDWPSQGQNAVQLLYRWLNSQGHVVSTSSPISLAQDLAAKASEPAEVTVQAPAQAGTYTLQWDLIQGNQTFSSAGAQPKNDSVTVTGSTPNPGPTPGPTPTASPSPQVHRRRKG